MVTVQGDVVSAQGLMIGGSRDKMTGILAKKQELKTAEDQLAVLVQQQAAALKFQKELEAKVDRAENEYQQMVTKKNSVAQAAMEAEKALYKATEDLKHARNRLEITQLEQEQLLGEEEDVDREIEENKALLNESTQAAKKVQDEVAVITGNIRSATVEMENFNRKKVDLQLDLTALTAKLENGRTNLGRLEEFKNDGMGRLDGIKAALATKKKEKEGTRQKIQELEQSEARRETISEQKRDIGSLSLYDIIDLPVSSSTDSSCRALLVSINLTRRQSCIKQVMLKTISSFLY